MSRAIPVRAALVLGLLALPLILLGDDPPSSEAPKKASTASKPVKSSPASVAAARPGIANEEKIRQALKSPIKVDWVELPLEECIQFLQSEANVNIWLDRITIADEGVQLDKPITLRLAGATLQSVLNLLLGPNLTVVIQNEVLTVTTSVKAGENLEMRIHPISKAIEGKESDSLIDLVTSTIEPETWDAVGGPGSIREMRGGLIVRQTQAVHDKLDAVLKDLERVLTTPRRPDIPLVGERTTPASEEKLLRVLDTPTDVNWVELPLEECIQFLQTAKDINLWIDRETISDEGVQRDSAVTLRLAGLRFESVLKLLLGPHQLDWVIEDEVMKITTAVHAGEKLVTTIYDVRDLLELMPAPAAPKVGSGVGGGFFDVPSQTARVRVLAQGFGGGGMGGAGGGLGGMAGCGTAWANRQMFHWDDHDAVGDLADLLTTAVEPDSWDAVGGPGTVREYLGTLVVRQTQKVHREIEKLFAEMRKVAAVNEANRPAKKPADPNALVLRVYQMPHYPAEDLAKSLPEIVATESWFNAGGKGTVRAVKGALLVRQTKAVHLQVIDLLNQLPIRDYIPQAPATKTDPPAKPDAAAKPGEPAKSAPTGGGLFITR